ncbi:HAD hydrolase-like protein [Rhodopseudomonas sp. AAP120]|uniref:HAD hydrolase-like protein n=1 Tax=Rhodopseudomonas sp. AAP120 TaxID=1523430 RepID=UPI0006B90577|nr:HAD hydrolase-like protein [Rhodopseudomonas sp. AAP120]
MKAFFFDLDGTLTNSREGLHDSFRAALTAIGVAPLAEAELDLFLGTPLPEMFRTLKPEIRSNEIAAGIDAFRDYYEAHGIRQNEAYPGVREMLQALSSKVIPVWVVTSKPQSYAERVVRDLGFADLVTDVVGAGLEELDTKTDLVRRALDEAGVSPEDAVMVGDRRYDIEGAKANGVIAVGVAWGYGTREELRSAGCDYLVDSVKEFCHLFIDQSVVLSTRTAAAAC